MLLIRKSGFCQKVTVNKDWKSPSEAIWKSLHELLNEMCYNSRLCGNDFIIGWDSFRVRTLNCTVNLLLYTHKRARYNLKAYNTTISNSLNFRFALTVDFFEQNFLFFDNCAFGLSYTRPKNETYLSGLVVLLLKHQFYAYFPH